MMTQFQKIKGTDTYLIRSDGAVLSLERKALIHLGNYRTVKSRILKQGISKLGYYTIALSRGFSNSRETKYIHRLLSEAFILNPENKPEVNHINGIRIDNRLENLEWVSRQENMIHSTRVLGNKNGMIGKFREKHFASKPILQLDEGNNVVKEWPCIAETKRNGFDPRNIHLCLRGKRKRHKGFKWQYAENNKGEIK
jgi:hypothetical protein